MDKARAEEVSLFGGVSRNRRDELNTDTMDGAASQTKPEESSTRSSQLKKKTLPQDEESETVRKMTGIESAKDRAQITSATAMSVVHVTLLKSVLDLGSENDPYYKYRLGFILAALILQVIAGFIALYVALLRSYYTKYRDDFLNDCLKTCCPWRCRRKKKHHRGASTKNKKSRATGSSISLLEEECEEDPGCCPFECTTQGYYHYEYQLLDTFEDISEAVIRSDVDAASADVDIKWFTERVDSLKEKMESYEKSSDQDSVAKLASINEELEEVIRRKTELEKRRQAADSVLAKGLAMEKHVQKIYQQHVLKRVTFWQNLLNMVFYVVFVLNAIIAGFGLVDPQSTPATDGSKAMATTKSAAEVTTKTAAEVTTKYV